MLAPRTRAHPIRGKGLSLLATIELNYFSSFKPDRRMTGTH
jgi:hypothetical protein